MNKLHFVLYKIDSAQKGEWIAVTTKKVTRIPSIIPDRTKKTTMYKVKEKLRPASKFKIGMRYITTMSKKGARLLAEKFVSEHWHLSPSMRKVYFYKRKAAILELYRNYYGDGTNPRIRIYKENMINPPKL
jgi:hypothetical protein